MWFSFSCNVFCSLQWSRRRLSLLAWPLALWMLNLQHTAKSQSTFSCSIHILKVSKVTVSHDLHVGTITMLEHSEDLSVTLPKESTHLWLHHKTATSSSWIRINSPMNTSSWFLKGVNPTYRFVLAHVQPNPTPVFNHLDKQNVPTRNAPF